MALLRILHHPDPRLRRKAAPVTQFDGALQQLIDDLFETMYDAPGTGLAANQCGVSLRLAVMDCSDAHNQPVVMINPEVISTDERREMDEGCLSVRYLYGKVKRSTKATIKAYNENGHEFTKRGEELLAQIFQHEEDHLNGVLFIDKAKEIEDIPPEKNN